jgi:hypothetical protein
MQVWWGGAWDKSASRGTVGFVYLSVLSAFLPSFLSFTALIATVTLVRPSFFVDRTALLGMHPEEAEEPRGRRRREWNGGTRIGMYYRR